MHLTAEKAKDPDSLHKLLAKELDTHLIASARVIHSYSAQIQHFFAHSKLLIIKPSSNLDLTTKLKPFSLLGVNPQDCESVEEGIKSAWRSLYSLEAIEERMRCGAWCPFISVLVQEMVEGEYSFVMCTGVEEVNIELAIGLSEGFSLNADATPYCLRFDKFTKKVEIKEFGNFSFEIQADEVSSNSTKRSRIDYLEPKYLIDEEELLKLGATLGEIALVIQEHCKHPQRIKGAVHENDIYLIQSKDFCPLLFEC
eukprot:TRINITY_DN3103_c0_g2_i1.p1 TRINITY_DN3103_c0_g2~~TRINITY_DN3103_c0_g2_i1.p1  ORF type:complete len:255 (-),score=61.07 TRINITY_DN3103_c0_g2_i1:114-878(-)